MFKISQNRLNVGKLLDFAPNMVWDLLTDTDKWTSWGPTLKEVDCRERFIRKGSNGKVLTIFGCWLPFVITEYKHASFWDWEVASLRATGHRVESIESGGCKLWFEVPIIAAPYAFICQLALRRIETLLCIGDSK